MKTAGDMKKKINKEPQMFVHASFLVNLARSIAAATSSLA